MIEKRLTYFGYDGRIFKFFDDDGREVLFEKVRNTLIWDFALDSKAQIGLKFKARYFIKSDANLSDTYILSDLELST